MDKKTVRDIDVKGKRVLLRCDFNVPLKGGEITDDTRISEALPTIKYLLEGGAKVILCSHLGRPNGEFNLKYTLKPVAARLNEYLGGRVAFCEDVIGFDAAKKIEGLKEGHAVLLENLRFHKEEEANDREFCKKLASFCDVYVNDAFGTAHRAHASTAGVAEYGFVKTAVMGFLIEKEVRFLGKAVDQPVKPFVAILGGAKVSDKIEVIENLLNKADTLIIGGGMAFTFLSALSVNVGKSLVETGKTGTALGLIESAKKRGVEILLPVDTQTAEKFPDPIDSDISLAATDINAIPENKMGLDIGPKTIEIFSKAVKGAKTVIWNGPMGVFENPKLAKGTESIARVLAGSGAVSVVGGGDTAAAVIKCGFADKMTHISTGGGAGLEFLGGKVLPGIACLNDK